MCDKSAPDLPDGRLVVFPVHPHLQKYFICRFGRNTSTYFAVSSHQQGRLAIVTNAGRDVVDVNAPLTNGVEADGEVVWF